MRLSKRPTPSELAVIAWAAILVLVIMGAVAMWYSATASPGQADVARQLRGLGWSSLVLAGIIWVIAQLCRKFLE